jgi:hypothetical protein
VTGGWRKLHNEELHNLYSSSSIIRMIKLWRLRWAGHVAQMRETRNAYRLLLGNAEGKRPIGRPRCGCLDDIKMDIKWGGIDWIVLTQDKDHSRALVNTVMDLQVP